MGGTEGAFYKDGSQGRLNIFVIKFSVLPKLLEVLLLFAHLPGCHTTCLPFRIAEKGGEREKRGSFDVKK